MDGTVAGRRYTTKELDALEAAQTQPATPGIQGEEALARSMDTFATPDNLANPPRDLTPLEFGKEVAGGIGNSLQRTYLGLKQLATYVAGNDDAREAVNAEIARLEQEHGDLLGTIGGRTGDFIGNAMQMYVPGAFGAKAGKALPDATKAVQAVTGKPGTVGRSTLTTTGYEATQPVEPGDLSNEEYLLQKGQRLAVGAGIGAPTAKVAGSLTKPWLQVDPERAALAAEADRLGLKLTPAQRTGDRTLQQYEEGLASKPGSGKLIAKEREAQQKVLNQNAAKALGVPYEAPNEVALALARENAAKGYAPLATLPAMPPDVHYFDDLHGFIKQQATKATGSTDAAAVAQRLIKGSGKIKGDGFLEELQGVRDLSFAARQKGDAATAKQLTELSDIMEDFADRSVEKFAKKGIVPADAMAAMRKARTEYAKIHAIEKATDPVTGDVSARKYLTQEFKRRPASKGPGTSDLDEGLRDVGSTARVLKQTLPYIGSSGTAERMAGQQMVEMTTGPLAAMRGAVPLAKNYLAAKYYLKYGGQPGYLGKYLSPEQNMLVRRLLPQDVLAAQEAMND